MGLELTAKELEIFTNLKSKVSKLMKDFDTQSIKDYDATILSFKPIMEEESDENFTSFVKVFFNFFILANSGSIKLKDFNKDTMSLGFSEMNDIIKGFLTSSTGNVQTDDTANIGAEYHDLAFLSTEIKKQEYMSKKTYIHDINTLLSILADEKIDGYNKAVLKDIQNNLIKGITNFYANTLEEILKINMNMYANTFGMYPYQAVLLFKGKTTVGSGYNTRHISYNSIIYNPNNNINGVFSCEFAKDEDMYYDVLCNNIKSLQNIPNISFPEKKDTTVYNHRTFDVEDILNCPDDSFVYYPMEQFAFATRAELGSRESNGGSNFHFKDSGCKSYQEYSSLVKDYLGETLAKYIYKYLETLSIQDGHGKSMKISFTSEDFISAYENAGANKADLYNIIPDCSTEITVKLNKFIRSVCSAYVVTRNDTNEFFKVKVLDIAGKENGVFSKNSTKDIFDNEKFLQNVVVEFVEGVKIECDKYNIYEYSFCRDVSLMDKKPLFGYTAARLFKNQGIAIETDNILIGESKDGTPMFSSLKNNTPVKISDCLFHRFVAGSRAGKGVITMNMLASYISEGCPVFYVDRKPEMSGLFDYISEHKMFTVNGGDLARDDVFQTYIEGEYHNQNCSLIMKRFEESDKSIFQKSYLTKVFGEDFGSKYSDAFGDFIYARGMMLAIGIVVARIYYTKNMSELVPSGRDIFCIDQDASNKRKKFVVVIDEVTNWHLKYESQFFETDPESGNMQKSVLLNYYNYSIGANAEEGDSIADISKMLDDDIDKLYRSVLETHAQAKEAFESDPENVELRKAFEKAHKDLDSIKVKMEKRRKGKSNEKDILPELYWTTYMDKYYSMIDYLKSINNAGFVESMRNDNDIIMIGQALNGVANTSGSPITFTASGDVGRRDLPSKVAGAPSFTRTNSYLYGVAECFKGGCDWFIGRNMSNTNELNSINPFFGGKNMSQELKVWLHQRGNWAYLPSGNQSMYRDDSVNANPSNAILFKPYLVLNTSDEVTSNGESPYTKETYKAHEGDKYRYVFQCADRVGFADWEKLRLQHISEPVRGKESNAPHYGYLEEGIGFKGMLVEYARTNPENANCEFSSDWLRSSGDIADAVCRQFGYESYIDYLFDFSPKGIISADDIIKAFSVKNESKSEDEMLAVRFTRYANCGKLHYLKSDLAEPANESEGNTLLLDEADMNLIMGTNPLTTNQANGFAGEYQSFNNSSPAQGFTQNEEDFDDPDEDEYYGDNSQPSTQGTDQSYQSEDDEIDLFDSDENDSYNDSTQNNQSSQNEGKAGWTMEMRYVVAEVISGYVIREAKNMSGKDLSKAKDLIIQDIIEDLIKRGY